VGLVAQYTTALSASWGARQGANNANRNWNRSPEQTLLRVIQQEEGNGMGILWTIIIGFVAGIIAKFIMPGDNEPAGFIMTTILGIVGAFVATFLGQSLGWYRPGEGAGLIGAVVGAIIVLLVYGMLAGRRRTV